MGVQFSNTYCKRFVNIIKKTLLVFLSSFSLENFLYAATSNIDIEDIGPSWQAKLISADGSVIVGASQNRAVKYNSEGVLVDLGTLGGTYSNANAVSDDGDVIVGQADTSANDRHAFKYTAEGSMLDLGTLGGNESSAIAVSANGKVIAGDAQTETGYFHAFKYTDKDKMVDLGTLGGNESTPNAISANGNVIVGWSNTRGSSDAHAFKHTDEDGIVDLGTLGGGFSEARAVSADGKVIVGNSEVDGWGDQTRAFKYTDEGGMVDLGSLGGNYSSAEAVSANGNVIAGQAHTSSGYSHAFKYTDEGGIVDLGTLGGNYSSANAMSVDGNVIVGNADTKTGSFHAFKHTDEDGMVDLGTLGGSSSSANAISADGRIIVGYAYTATGELHAALWRIIDKEIGLIDVDNTQTALAKSALNAQRAIDLQGSRLDRLASQECLYSQGRICIGGYTGYTDGKNSNQSDLALTLGYGLTEQLRIGMTLDYAYDTQLSGRYKTAGNTRPGVGLFIGYQQHPNGTGWQGRLGAAHISDDITITRDVLSFTEAGKGKAKIKGQEYVAKLGYGINVKDTLLVPYAALQYRKVIRSKYHETEGAIVAPVSYSQMGEKRTSLNLGGQLTKSLTPRVKLDLDMGVALDINNHRQAYKAKVDLLGDYQFGQEHKDRARPYVGAGISYQATPNAVIRLGAGWSKQSYNTNTTNVQLSVGYSF